MNPGHLIPVRSQSAIHSADCPVPMSYRSRKLFLVLSSRRGPVANVFFRICLKLVFTSQKGSEGAEEKGFQLPKCSIQRASAVTLRSFWLWGSPIHHLEHPSTLNIIHLFKRFEALTWESGISHARAHLKLVRTCPLGLVLYPPSAYFINTAQDCELDPPFCFYSGLYHSRAVVSTTATPTLASTRTCIST